nr:MAG TPA: hypothetical protein [Caudoviricetes sp.]
MYTNMPIEICLKCICLLITVCVLSYIKKEVHHV